MIVLGSPDSVSKRNPLALLALVGALLLGLALLGGCSGQDGAAKNDASQVVDMRGRPLDIAGPYKRIAIDDSRYLVALGLIHKDPVSLLAAWPKDVNRLGDETYQQYLKLSPGLENLPKIASSAEDFNPEALLAARPDLALLSLESGVTDAQIAQLEAAGIKVVIVDFFVKPLQNLEPSLRLLGELTGQADKAEEFIAYRAERMKRIADAVAKVPAADRPTVFFEAHAGMGQDCCNSPGSGNIGDYLNFVGGENIGSDVIKQAFGKLNLEYVISRDPAVYIASGGPHLKKAGGLVLGAGFTKDEAQASLVKVSQRRGISGLSAVKDKNTHGISHQLVNSPLDIVAIEAIAKWVHPELFADVDPAKTLEEVNSRFLAVPYEGLYWVDLP